MQPAETQGVDLLYLLFSWAYDRDGERGQGPGLIRGKATDSDTDGVVASCSFSPSDDTF